MNICHNCCLTIEKLNKEYEELYKENYIKNMVFSQNKIEIAKKITRNLSKIFGS